jgi:hypothetical protein
MKNGVYTPLQAEDKINIQFLRADCEIQLVGAGFVYTILQFI